MFSNALGNNLATVNYQNDPYADKFLPDPQKLSMAAWGMPEMSDMETFNPEMEKNPDTVPPEFNQYVTKLNDLTATAHKFQKIGIDITQPSLDPQKNAAHLEWLKEYTDNIKLGKMLSQSHQLKTEYDKKEGRNGIWTNPYDESKMLTTLNGLVYNPNDKPVQMLLQGQQKREQFVAQGDLESATKAQDEAEQAVTQWYDNEKQNQPQFADRLEAEKQLKLSQFHAPIMDSKFLTREARLAKQHAEDLGYKYQKDANTQAGVKAPEVDNLFEGAINGNLNSQAFTGLEVTKGDGQYAGQKVTLGASKLLYRNGKPWAIQTAAYALNDGGTAYNVPAGYINTKIVEEDGARSYSSTQLYQAKFGAAVKTKTPASNPNTPQDAIQVGAKNSTTSTTTNKVTASGLPVFK